MDCELRRSGAWAAPVAARRREPGSVPAMSAPLSPSPSTSLPEAARALLDRPEFATVATIEPDGQPHLSVVWVGRDGDDVLFSTLRGRRKATNLERDARATVLVYPADDPYRYLEIRGTATLEDDPDASLIDEMSHKYTGGPWTKVPADVDRVVVRVSPTKVVLYS